MNKQKILELTGLSEDQFYDQYPDQETFCSDYPDACNQLEEAQGGMQVGKVYDKYGNETFTPAPDPIHSDWQINDEGMNVRPRTVDRFGNPIGPTTQVLRIPVDRVPFNREPTMQRLNPAIQSLQHESANNVPTTSPIDILTPLIARYSLPKGMVQNSIPIEKLSAKQTMQSVGSTGAPYTAPVNKYKSIVDSLKASGQDSSFASRKKLAEEKGITGYTGTAAQNMALMNAINSNDSYQNGGVYIVKSGDTLSNIANKNNTSLQQVLQMNHKFQSNPNLIHVGDKVMLGNGMGETPLQKSNREYGSIADSAIKMHQGAIKYPVTVTDARKYTPKSLPSKKQNQPNYFNNILEGVNESFNKIINPIENAVDYAKTFVTDPTFRERVFGRIQNEDPNSIITVKIPQEKKINQAIPFGYNQLGAVRDVKSSNPKDSLLSYSYTGDNETGVPFVIGNMAANKTKDTFQNVHGVGHFLMDADVLPNQLHTEPYIARGNEFVASSVPGKFINAYTSDPEAYNMFYKPTGKRPNEYYVAYSQNKNGKKYLDKKYEGDLTLRNVKFSDVDWEGSGNKTGYFTKSNWVPKKDGSQTSLIYRDKDAFSRFSGGSGIYIFKDPISGKEIQSNVSGSINTIKNWGKNIIDKYKINPEDLQLLYHDMGSYSAKPKADNNGVLNYNQWSNYNTYNKGRSGAPLIIPKEQGGTAIFPSMRNFKQGGYYGMDQKFHPNSDSGTYVTGAGYYFDTGGGTTASPASAPGTSGGVDVSGVPGAGAAGADGIRADGSFAVNDSKMPDGGYDGSGMMMDDSAYEQSSPFDYNSSQFSEQSANKQQQYDPSQYTSEIDPSTGFTKYKKNGLAIKNIKREDPALWNNLTEQGHGARWATGQTDIQRVGRTAGAIGQGLEAGINVAGAIGGYLNNRNKQRNMDKSAINMGSTASMFTNPQGSGKGDYGVTGSTYGQFKPNQSGNMSFKGMYGKYGMQVPKYAVGGFEPQLDISEDYKSVGPNQNTVVPFVESYNSPLAPVDNTRADSSVVPLEIREQQTGPLDVDLALQAISGHESGVKPGQTKVGLKTRIVGEGGKRASASGTYQITTPTLQQIYKNDKNINSEFNTFNQFKSAFDTDPKVEYAAAKSLMSDHIKNYGVYALGAWFYPTFAKRAMEGDKSVFNIIPRKDYGNEVEWGTDFKNKLNSYNKLAGTNYDISSAISIKSPSVNIKNLHPKLLNFTNVISQNFPGLVLTSGNDSKHMKGSKHYGNKAIDIGANSSNKQAYVNLKKYLKSNPSIKKQYGIEDIIDEGNHLHLEIAKYGGQQQGGQVVDMEEDDIKQFLAAGGQLEFLD